MNQDDSNTRSAAHATEPVGSPVLSEGLGPGDWLTLLYGSEERVFYVLRVNERGAWVGHPGWLVRSAIFLPHERLRSAERLGRGLPRWWWRFVPWRQACLPFSKPPGLFWA